MDENVKSALTSFLKDMIDVFNSHSEYGDTLCKELLGDYLWRYYIHELEKPNKENIENFNFGLDDEEGERAVRDVVYKNIHKILEASEKAGMNAEERYNSLYADVEYDGIDISEFIGERDIDTI